MRTYLPIGTVVRLKGRKKESNDRGVLDDRP